MNPQTDSNSEWQQSRALYPIYSALAREFVIDVPPCEALEMNVDSASAEAMQAARQWFVALDERIGVHQLRQFLQTTAIVSDEGLRNLLDHHLACGKDNAVYRDKVDFLLVQYFSHCAPSRLDDADVTFTYVAETLEPVLCASALSLPDWLGGLDDIIKSAQACRSLNDLLQSAALDEGRKIKISAGDKYFDPAAMVAFTRFSFLMRRVFFRLMHQDLNAIIDGLRELENRGISIVDCRRAQFSAEEPTVRLRIICQSWKVMFHAEYSSGQPLKMLVDLHAAVDAALADGANGEQPKPLAMAASAGADSSQDGEFEVSSTPAWDPDTSNS